MTIDASEQELVDRLRAKYGTAEQRARGTACEGAQDGFPSAQASLPADNAGETDLGRADRVRQFAAHTDVKPCSACLGQGQITYEYNHRVMQRPCDECDGEGCCVFVDGARRRTAGALEGDQPAGLDGRTPPLAPVLTESQRQRIRELEAQVQRIQARIAALSAERCKLVAALGSATDDLERSLVDGGVHELDAQLARLQATLVGRQDRLAYYDRADGATAAAGHAEEAELLEETLGGGAVADRLIKLSIE